MSQILKPRWQSLIAATLAVVVCGRSALADDTEIFTGSSSAGAQPNILFILDTSGSMASPVTTQAAYNPATTYAGSCSTALVYFQASGGGGGGNGNGGNGNGGNGGAGGTPRGGTGQSAYSTTYQKCQSA